MPVYLIDVNLPYYFPPWKNEDFFFVKDIGEEWKDNQIWKYALENNLIIVIKDTDFLTGNDIETTSKGYSYLFWKRVNEGVFQHYRKYMATNSCTQEPI